MKLNRSVVVAEAGVAIDILAQAMPELSKSRLKDAMAKGAVQLLSKPQKRLRRSQTALKKGDKLSVHYDSDLLQRQCDAAVLLHDERRYSIWYKPAGMLSQGNEWGDHLSLLRAAEQSIAAGRQVFLVHRLDREASGLVLLAHTKPAAAAFSQLMAERKLDKGYIVQIKGQLPAEYSSNGEITLPLDGKASCSRFRMLHYDAKSNSSWLEVQLITGRKHQIRRHFAAIGHPVLGDPQYGEGNKNTTGLALQAVSLQFVCPFAKKIRQFVLPAHYQLLPSFADVLPD